MSHQKPKDKSEVTGSFTFDSESSYTKEMPSISSLLNRRSLRPTQSVDRASRPHPTTTAAPSAPSPLQPREQRVEEIRRRNSRGGFDEPAVEVERTLTNLFIAPAVGPVAPVVGRIGPTAPEAPAAAPAEPGVIGTPPALKITPARRRPLSSVPSPAAPLIEWQPARLARSSDPLGRGIAHLLEAGAGQSLFLRVVAPTVPGDLPRFVAVAAVAEPQVLALWRGLAWDPKVSPELWNEFVRMGYVELPPAGSHTDSGSARNLARVAFGVAGEDWLTLLRVGPPQACRGLLALISRGSLYGAWRAALPLLSAMPESRRKAA